MSFKQSANAVEWNNFVHKHVLSLAYIDMDENYTIVPYGLNNKSVDWGRPLGNGTYTGVLSK